MTTSHDSSTIRNSFCFRVYIHVLYIRIRSVNNNTNIGLGRISYTLSWTCSKKRKLRYTVLVIEIRFSDIVLICPHFQLFRHFSASPRFLSVSL